MSYICVMETKINNPYPLSPTSGTMQEDKIVGRENEITSLLRLLKGQSVSVEEIRRMGKTLLVQKLAYKCNSNNLPEEFKDEKFKAKYFTFQGQDDLGHLISYLILELKKMKEWYQIDFDKTLLSIKEIINSPTLTFENLSVSINLPMHQKHWKDIFNKVFDDISANLIKHKSKLILIFDELPIMLWEWYKKGKQDDAMLLLNILRERRQKLEPKGLRFIFCGSIGMQIVLDTFRTNYGYTGEATNDMAKYSVGSFNLKEVQFLCECYTLSGFQINEPDKLKLWEKVYHLSNGIPFYVSKLFNIIQTDYNKSVTKANIDSSYESIINDPIHHDKFKQLLDRINIYYSEPIVKAKSMKAILDFLSSYEEFVSEEDIIYGINQEDTKTLLYTLLADHYLLREIKSDQRHYKIKYEIFRKWWKINQA